MITLRLAKPEDCAGMLEIYEPFIKNSATSFESEVPGTEVFWERVRKVLRESPWMVCEWDGIIAGYAYASAHRSRAAYQWTRELSVYIHPDFRKKHIAQALYTAMIEVLKMQGYCNILAGITMPNEASLKFHQQFGFKPLGIYEKVGFKFGKWQDTHWLQLFIGDPQKGAPALKPLDTIKDTKAFEQALQGGLGLIKSE